MSRKKKNLESERLRALVAMKDVPGLERVLKSTDTKGVHLRVAMEALIDLGSHSAWDAIGRVLTESQTAVIEVIISLLDDSGTPGAVRALGECLSNPNVFIRSGAVRALSRHESAVTMAPLLRASRDPEPTLARMASRIILRRLERSTAVLAEVKERTVEGILDLMDDRWAMELLSDAFPLTIRKMAARRLGQIGGDEATQTLTSLVQAITGELAEACWEGLEHCPSVSSFVLLPLLVDPRPDIKARAIGIYANNADETALDLITGLTRDGHPLVRIAALRGVAQISDVGAIPTLEAALEDVDDEVRLVTVDLLTNIDESSPELVRAVMTQSGDIRQHALICLANRSIVTSDLVQYYVEFLFKGSSVTDLSQRDYLDAMSATAKALGKAQAFEGMLALTALGRSVIRRIRRAAIEGLMNYPPQDRVDALFSLLDTHDTDIVKNIAMGMHEAEDPRAVVPLIRTALECRGKPMVRAKEYLKEYPQTEDVDFLISGLSEKWPSVRRFSAEKLKFLKDPKSIPALLETSRDEDVEVQLAVFEAMGPFASEHDEVRERMLESIGYGDISVRQATCEALGEARCKEAVPELIRALHNFFLRPRATEALRRIGDRKGYLALKRIEIREKLFPKGRQKLKAGK